MAGVVLTSTADRTPVAVLELEDGRVLDVNPAACRLLGRDTGDLVGRRLSELLSVGSRFFFETHCRPILAARGEVAEVSLEVRGAHGRCVPVLLYGSCDEAGRLRLVLVTAFERHAHDAELRRMRRRERAHNDLQALKIGRAHV